jgi:stringent starvation protein B
MIIPHGMTFNVKRKEYGEGMELPADAPEPIKKAVAERIAKIAEQEAKAKSKAVEEKADEREKHEKAEKRKALEKRAVDLKLGMAEEVSKLSDADLEALVNKAGK